MAAPFVDRPRMQSYGVPADPDGLLPWSWARDRLERSRNFGLCTVTPQGHPHSLPVWAVWLDDRSEFFFSCATDSRKAINLASNPHVVLSNDDLVEVISVEGIARPVTGPETQGPIAAYVAKYAPLAEGTTPEELAGFVRCNSMFLVRAERAFGIIERPEEFSQRATRWRWRSATPTTTFPTTGD